MSQSTAQITPNQAPNNLGGVSLEDTRTAVLTEFASLLGSHSVGDGSAWRVSNSSTTGESSGSPGTALSMATDRIAGQKTGKFAKASLSKLITQHLHRDNDHPTGGAICCFPSLDLYSDEDESSSMNILPEVGVSRRSAENASHENMPPPTTKIPVMAASVFRESNSAGNGATNGSSEQIPNMASLQTSAVAATNAASNANANAAKLEQAAARNLGAETKWTPSSVSQAPSAMLRSLAASFSSLVDSRVRAWTLLLLRHSLSSGDEQSRSRLLALLATSNRIDLTAIVTNYKVLNVKPVVKPTSAPDTSSQTMNGASRSVHFEDGSGNDKTNEDAAASQKTSDDYDAVFPMMLEATIDVMIEGQKLTVNLRSPGAISANFHENTAKITYAKIKLDTNVLVSSMVEQARLIVFKAVARATSLPASAKGLGNIVGSGGMPGSTSSQSGVASLSSGFGSGLNLKAAQQSPSLPRQNNSSLKMSSFGKDSSTNLGNKRKQRSVTWNQPIEDHDSSKRQIIPMKPTIMRSTKSFGKPDASVFESSRNATFGDFGRLDKSNHLPQFVNGKLQVPNTHQKPVPQKAGLSQFNRGQSMGNILRANTNASFKPQAPTQGTNPTLDRFSLIRNAGNNGTTTSKLALNRNNGSNAGSQVLGRQTFGQLSRGLSRPNHTLNSSGQSQSQLPRTATALESLLLQASRKK